MAFILHYPQDDLLEEGDLRQPSTMVMHRTTSFEPELAPPPSVPPRREVFVRDAHVDDAPVIASLLFLSSGRPQEGEAVIGTQRSEEEEEFAHRIASAIRHRIHQGLFQVAVVETVLLSNATTHNRGDSKIVGTVFVSYEYDLAHDAAWWHVQRVGINERGEDSVGGMSSSLICSKLLEVTLGKAQACGASGLSISPERTHCGALHSYLLGAREAGNEFLFEVSEGTSVGFDRVEEPTLFQMRFTSQQQQEQGQEQEPSSDQRPHSSEAVNEDDGEETVGNA
eukprot:PhM_4_TR11901/c0_g1_i1/m.27186